MKNNHKGITLVSLVITIIIMLILAGVSMSMVTGDSSVLGQAKKTAFMQEMAGYKEELETEILGRSAKFYAENLKELDTSKIKLAGSYMKEYIPSMKEEDYDDYMIVGGKLYYVGDDEFELGICSELGYVTKAPGQSAEEFVGSIENDILQDLVIGMAGNAFTKYNEEKDAEEEIGLKLARKVASSGFGQGVSDPWTIITEVDESGNNVSTYADGWYYVKAGEEIPGLGKLRYSYIINYAENKAERFTDRHIILSNEGNLAVTDKLVFNADPTNMDGSTTSWGGATLSGFTGTEKDENNNVISGWTPTSLNFDGKNDFLEYKIPSTFQTEGITIEFYGYLDNSKGYSTISFYKGPSQGASNSFKHTLSNVKSGTPGCKVPNDILQMAGVYTTDTKPGGGYYPSGSKAQCPNWCCDFHIRLDDKPHTGDIFITYVLNKNGEYKVYKDGKLILEDAWNADYAAKYNQHLSNTGYPIQLGVWYQGATRHYAKQKIYSLRVYEKLLTAEEVELNYKASSSYHKILENDGKADNNNTGGEDIDSVLGKE